MPAQPAFLEKIWKPIAGWFNGENAMRAKGVDPEDIKNANEQTVDPIFMAMKSDLKNDAIPPGEVGETKTLLMNMRKVKDVVDNAAYEMTRDKGGPRLIKAKFEGNVAKLEVTAQNDNSIVRGEVNFIIADKKFQALDDIDKAIFRLAQEVAIKHNPKEAATNMFQDRILAYGNHCAEKEGVATPGQIKLVSIHEKAVAFDLPKKLQHLLDAGGIEGMAYFFKDRFEAELNRQVDTVKAKGRPETLKHAKYEEALGTLESPVEVPNRPVPKTPGQSPKR